MLVKLPLSLIIGMALVSRLLFRIASHTCHPFNYIRFRKYLKASPLPPAPLAVAGFMVAGLAAWQYSDRLAGLLECAVWFLFCEYSLLECLLARWFLDVSSQATFLAFAAASPQPLPLEHCFKALGSDRFDGLLVR